MAATRVSLDTATISSLVATAATSRAGSATRAGRLATAATSRRELKATVSHVFDSLFRVKR
jgi:hypothetical protein